MGRKLYVFVRSAVLFAVLLVFAVACTRGGKDIEVDLPSGEKAVLKYNETLRIMISSEPPSLDWHRATDTTSNLITVNLMEGLAEYDLSDKDLKLIPALAEKWEASDNARKWKITVRQDVVWSDGVPFTVQHVVDGWKRLLSKETASEYAYFLFGIKNAKAFNEGKKSWDEVGVKISGPNELTVELEKSMSYFPYLLTHHSTYPIRLDVVEKGGDRWTEPGNIVTLGPFTLKVWQHDRLIVLERNEKYYGQKPQIKHIAAYMIQEQATAINLFDSGKLDSVHDLPSVELRRLRQRKEFRETSRLSIYYYGFNVAKPPLDNPLVRKAIAMAIDRQQIVQMLAGGQLPLTGWIPAGMFGYEANRGVTFDPEKARELLKQAGYGPGTKLPKLEIRFNTNEDHQRIAENIQAQLKQNLGIEVELKNEEWKVYLNSLKSKTQQIFRLGWQADYPDPDNFMSVMLSYSENNHTNWKNAKYDELVNKAAGTLDRDERLRLYSEAQKILVEDDVPVVPLYSTVKHVLINPRVENYPLNVMEVFSYKGVRLKD